jgi:cyanophycinase
MGVWFPGGVQTRITETLRGTRLQRALQELHKQGAVLGGTSAGAAIMSDSMLTGSQYQPGVDTAVYTEDSYTRIARRSIELVPGLGFLPGVIVDQHFVRRERHNRLLSVVLERPHLIGAGIDEQTAIEVRPDGSWHILGNSVVLIYDARRGQVNDQGASVLAASDVRMHILAAGGSFDPRTGVAQLRAR